jgi:hypothetical protein
MRHAGVLRVLHGARLGRVGTVMELRPVHVVVRGDGSVGHKDRTAITAALAGAFGQRGNRGHARVCFDVRYAVCGIDANAHNMRLFPQASFDEFNTRGTAPPSDRNVERF